MQWLATCGEQAADVAVLYGGTLANIRWSTASYLRVG
jgi:hypothetical protein